MASILCGNCKLTHQAVTSVRRCYAGEAGPCGWQSYVRDRWGTICDEDGSPIIDECKALAWDNGRAITCENGHEHVHAQNRAEEGWEYAENIEEAARLAKVGVRSVAMDGSALLPC